ncbi:MAG: hypothetical protein ACFFB2_12485 [Promethearchaeota archaeon]
MIYADQYHNFVFLEYEGVKQLLHPKQLGAILEQIRHYLVFMVAVRGCEFHFQRKFLLENYIYSSRQYPSLLFCIVAGHSSNHF